MRLISLVAILLVSAFQSANVESPVKWMRFEEAVEANKEASKKIFIDVYTDWCGWCKRMDASTFADARVAAVLEKNFHNVKFNAEQHESIQFKDHTFKFIPSGRRGYHELAASLLSGKLSYPTVVFMNEDFQIIQVLPGYRNADEFLKIVSYIGEDHYLTTPWEDYKKSFDASQYGD